MKHEIDQQKRTSYFFAEWAEIVNIYREYNEGIKIPRQDRFKEQIESWKDDYRDFYGNTSEEMLEFLNKGYEFESKINADLLPVVASHKKRQKYSDDPEGEYSHDLYNMGEVDYFLVTPKRESLIGIRMHIMYDFLAHVPASVVAEYAQWIGGVVDALQERGYDLEIMLTCYGEGSYTDSSVSKTKFDIRLSKFGERVMPYDWSACFAPGGFRHFFFLSIYEGAEITDLTAEWGLGTSPHEDFDIKWEPKAREIEITVNPHAGSFPAKEMTDKFTSWTE